jgi:tetratricopeptide repeat protein 30
LGEEDSAVRLQKLTHLLAHPQSPPDTLVNLLLLHCNHRNYYAIAPLLVEHGKLVHEHITWMQVDYFVACATIASSVEEASQKFFDLSARHFDVLRKLSKSVEDARLIDDDERFKTSAKLFNEAVKNYFPVLMAHTRIYWDREDFVGAEKLFRNAAEFCATHDVFRLNLAHVCFMQGNKFKEAVRYYEPFVHNMRNALLQVQPHVLANLCISYIMISNNENAEEIMRNVYNEEEQLKFAEPDKQPFHLCMINLGNGFKLFNKFSSGCIYI